MGSIDILRHAFFGGYRKKDVCNYIEKMNEKLNEKQTFYELKIAQMELEAKEGSEQISSLRHSLQDEQEKNAKAVQENLVLTRENQLMKTQLEEQEERLRLLNEELDNQMEIASKAAAKMKAHQLKSEKYDHLNGQIGDIVLNAHSYANKVIETAKQEATALAADSLDHMSQLSSKVSGINQEISEVGGKVGNYVQQMNTLLSELTAEIETAVSRIQPLHTVIEGVEKEQQVISSAAEEPSIFNNSSEESQNTKKLKIKVKLDEISSGALEEKGNPQSPRVLS